MKTKIISTITAIKEGEWDKYQISKASLKNEVSVASSFMSPSMDERNIDLMPAVFSIAKVNKFNDNDDAITPIEAAQLLSLFPHKPINVEHSKGSIVGHLIDAGFADFEPAFKKENVFKYLDRKDDFFIAGAGLIYRSIYPDLAEAIAMASDPYEDSYNAYAMSWEISFEYFDISVGNGDYISQNRTVTANDPDFQSLCAQLKANKGNGRTHNGEKVRRILRGDKIPLGIAITENPAAEVKGIYALASINSKKISKTEEINVTDNETDVAMDDNQFKELKEILKEAVASKDTNPPKNVAEEAFQKITQLLEDKGADWKSKSASQKEELDTAKANIDELTSKLDEANNKIEQFKNDLAVRDTSDRYNDRMAAIANIYQLEKEEDAIVAKRVKDLSDDDAAFTSYLEELKVIFPHRNKEAIAAAAASEGEEEDAVEPKGNVSNASITTIDNGNSALPNTVGQGSEEGKSFLERLKETGLVLEETK